MIKKIIPVIVAFLLGYFVANLLPLKSLGLFPRVEDSEEFALKPTLEVLVETEDGDPVTGLEIDVAERPGQPPEDGVAITNSAGVASFNMDPGNYFVFFNSNNFPAKFQPFDPIPITIRAGDINQETIILKEK